MASNAENDSIWWRHHVRVMQQFTRLHIISANWCIPTTGNTYCSCSAFTIRCITNYNDLDCLSLCFDNLRVIHDNAFWNTDLRDIFLDHNDNVQLPCGSADPRIIYYSYFVTSANLFHLFITIWLANQPLSLILLNLYPSSYSDVIRQISVNVGSCSGVVPDSTKPLVVPNLSSHWRGSVTFIWEQFHSECSPIFTW